MANAFPPNPSDGLIFEASSGVFYQFTASLNCWIRLDGVDALGLATPSQAGLMSKEDFRKISELLIPPPRTALTSEDCSHTFENGIIGLRSSEEHLEINHKLKLMNKAAGDIEEDVSWKIHENTFGYDFRINVEKFIEELTLRGNFTIRQLIGDQGDQGDKGDDGIDELDTGPVGPDGIDGANAPFGGTLSPDTTSGEFELLGEENRAVVAIRAEKISDDENFLVLTRANIGNLDACPGLIRPKKFDSPLVLVVEQDQSKPKIIKESQITDCQIICAVCSSLFHLDMQSLIDQIFERFKELVTDLKATKEELVNIWLSTLVSNFHIQRDAICCAIENCESSKRNQDARRYIEQTRVSAAQGDFKVIIDGVEEREITDLEGNKKCESGGQVIDGDPDDCLVGLTFELDPRANVGGPSRALSAQLAAGSYIAEIEDCCAEFAPGQFNGIAVIEYEPDDPECSIGRAIVPNFGFFPTNEEARNTYLGLCIPFVHGGGIVKAWYHDHNPDDNSGIVTLVIKSSVCFEVGTEPTGAVIVGVSCEMEASQVCWYERGWRTGACCGVHVLFGGEQWLIVKRSIGTDLTCGGGESLSTPCIAEFINNRGHPAIAFPTIDGDEFLGKPETGTQAFAVDDVMNQDILDKISAGDIIESRGNPDEITFIIFPVMT